MSAFAAADVVVPENFHEIAGLRLCEIGEVPAEPELVKQSTGAGTVRVPSAPNAFAVVLIANDQLIQRREIELQLAAVAQRLDRFDENQIRRAGTETHVRLCRDDEEFSGFEMRSRLELDLRDV